VAKEDAYNQTVVSDYSSFVQLQIAGPSSEWAGGSAVEQQTDPLATLSGGAVFKLQAGQAKMYVAVKPAFIMMKVANSQQLGRLRREVFLFASGEDRGSSQLLTILSSQVSVTFASGEAVCPKGYILSLDSSAGISVNALGTCTYCKAGTYSIHPLAGGPNETMIAACLDCPPESTCSGGDQVILGPGKWMAASNGMYILVGCPPGHELINSIGGAFRHDIQVRIEM
jgi:hypothetical protein